MFHSYILTLDYNVYLYLINRMVVNSRVKSGVMAMTLVSESGICHCENLKSHISLVYSFVSEF
jgi:hypothetical protein